MKNLDTGCVAAASLEKIALTAINRPLDTHQRGTYSPRSKKLPYVASSRVQGI
ncbi:hypothetical protein [Aeromonas sp. CA23]|uniref:hypothetical protein n=1 Tax=Aeromonas sp. CA23 TaxID=2033032 RepID=UPI0012FD1A9B|nr:hypothetical protein [Aeromonas sp. CA23]